MGGVVMKQEFQAKAVQGNALVEPFLRGRMDLTRPILASVFLIRRSTNRRVRMRIRKAG